MVLFTVCKFRPEIMYSEFVARALGPKYEAQITESGIEFFGRSIQPTSMCGKRCKPPLSKGLLFKVLGVACSAILL